MVQRTLLEPRGARRLSSQTLLDLRIPFNVSGVRFELLPDVRNALIEPEGFAHTQTTGTS